MADVDLNLKLKIYKIAIYPGVRSPLSLCATFLGGFGTSINTHQQTHAKNINVSHQTDLYQYSYNTLQPSTPRWFHHLAPRCTAPDPFISRQAPFISRQAPFISRQAPFISRQAPFISRQAPFISKQALCHSLRENKNCRCKVSKWTPLWDRG